MKKKQPASQKEYFETQLASQQEYFETQLASQKEYFETQLASQKMKLEKQQKDYETQLKSQEEDFEEQLAAQEKKFEKQKKCLEEQLTNKTEENQELQKKLVSLKKEHANKEDKFQPKEMQSQNNTNPIKEIEILDSSQINNLERIEKIGHGSGGEVVKVALKKFYALKIMEINNKTHEALRLFMNEYEIMNLLNHLNILKTHGIFLGNETNPPMILLEYCPTNLDNKIKEKTMTKCDLVFTIYQIVEGMKYVHYQKVIHRDLKPTNILVASDGTIKICDFGISKLMTAEEQSMTKGLGTQKFMAPEIINEEDYDEKVDVYSFGVIAYFILSGGEMPKIKIRDICLGKKAEIPSSFTPFAEELINACWNFDPKERPSFKKICNDIELNKFNLLQLTKSEIQQVEDMVKQHKEKIPQYDS
ncbi:hypothetical protein M9Y10_036633 [Tritrichomonas musculus]|uniref:mitogen-activated protein kinase kinase n=1 Tax=Tritrichomonas musculus TaxID=1915356 RepID=A0ABR2GTK2_9EUKA